MRYTTAHRFAAHLPIDIAVCGEAILTRTIPQERPERKSLIHQRLGCAIRKGMRFSDLDLERQQRDIYDGGDENAVCS